MPITARLSRRFYEKLGDEVTNELVEWLNAVDSSYRQEFRELFEAHFSRLEARLDSARAELRAEFKVTVAQSEKSLIRHMFGFWIGQLATTVGLLLLLRQFFLSR